MGIYIYIHVHVKPPPSSSNDSDRHRPAPPVRTPLHSLRKNRVWYQAPSPQLADKNTTTTPRSEGQVHPTASRRPPCPPNINENRLQANPKVPSSSILKKKNTVSTLAM